MDSLTQIVLGAACGEVALGKKLGNKAMLYGAIAGTIPDLDVLASNFTDTTMALHMHRGFTHSILFAMVFSPLLAWLVSKYEKYKDIKGWTWLFFLAFITHPLLDAHTTWGTQLFWPFDLRLAFKTIFVIDPLYTFPFLIFLILAMLRHRTDVKRRKYNNWGLIISSSYLLLTVVLKFTTLSYFKDSLKSEGITYAEIDTRPAPLNTILWSANIDTKDAYLLGNYSFFDSKPVSWTAYDKNHHLIKDIIDNERVKRMIHISKGWYSISQEGEKLFFNDLRFGLLSMQAGSQDFVFKYEITKDKEGMIVFTEVEKSSRDGKKLIKELFERIKGN
ncbi:MAG: metal-dependent hydrolase [Bacteroidia bacterium]